MNTENGSRTGGKTDGGRTRLREAIRNGHFLAGTYLPSARDLAKKLDISKSSVHNILKMLQDEGLIQIYPTRGALVLANNAIRREPRRIFLRPSDYGTFRYLPVASKLMLSVIGGAEKKNIELMVSLSDSGRLSEEMMTHHTTGTIQGVIYLQCGNYDELIAPLEKAKIPCVIAADDKNNTQALRTFIDFRAAARQAVRHLAARGHRKIGVIAGSEKSYLYSEMLAGFRGALAEENLDFHPEWCLTRVEFEQQVNQTGVIERFLKKQQELPSAIFTIRDYRAAWLYEAAARLNLRIPDDLSVISFDNNTWQGADVAGLTTLAEPLQEQGEQAVKLLCDWISTGVRPDSVEFKPTLIERASITSPR